MTRTAAAAENATENLFSSITCSAAPQQTPHLYQQRRAQIAYRQHPWSFLNDQLIRERTMSRNCCILKSILFCS